MNETMNKNRKSLAIVIILLIVGFCMLIPVWQSAVSTGISSKMEESRENIIALNEKKMSVKGSIARKTTPEFLIEQASVQNINFTQISESTNVTVASAF
ncbi:MAG: hypothetical protein K5634_05465 [Sphaerochaetaceae bacterium]|nr:hypothetical protein [Sphaerochaetaceae bacterium]